MEEMLKLLQNGLHYAAMLEGILPQIEEMYATLKKSLSSDDRAAIRAQIDTMHATIQNNAAVLESLRDPKAK